MEPPAIDRTSTVDCQSTYMSKSIADSTGTAATKLTLEVSTGRRTRSRCLQVRNFLPTYNWDFSGNRLGQALVRCSDSPASTFLLVRSGCNRSPAACSSVHGPVDDVGVRHGTGPRDGGYALPQGAGGSARPHRTGDVHHVGVIKRPRAERLNEWEKTLTGFSQCVVDPGRYFEVVGAADQPVLFEVPQRPGQRLLRDATDAAQQLAISVDTVVNGRQDQDRPLVGDEVQHGPGRACGVEEVGRPPSLAFGYGHRDPLG